MLCGILELDDAAGDPLAAGAEVRESGRAGEGSGAGETRDPIKGAVNVRRTLSASTGGVVLDTLGLGALGLPDFEISLGDRMPALFDALLRSVARYEYDLGDVIADGRVFKGEGSRSWPSGGRRPPSRTATCSSSRPTGPPATPPSADEI